MKAADNIERLRRKMAEKEVEALLVSQPENLYYLSGCEGLEGYILVHGREAIIATDFRYLEQAERQSPECSLFRIEGKLEQWFPRLLEGLGLRKLSFESHHLSFASYEHLAGTIRKADLPVELTPCDGMVEELRMTKDPEEIERIAGAARIADDAIEYIQTVIEPGMTEKEVAWEIEKHMRECGSQTVPFELIVAAGPNSALPHARPSDYIIREGEPITMDIGARYRFYASDLTRTICLGRPDETFKKVYRTVLEAQTAALREIRAGMTGQEADAVARKIIADAGYGATFGHSLGHGIGLVIHENPRVGPNSGDVLTEGMVFTVEPGIYISGWGGVRIEDDVVVENGKLRVITSAAK